MTETLFQHAGATLFAVERGSGAPLVFLHGGLADHRVALVRFATYGGRLIAPDARGAGRSHWSGELSWELLADDVAALLDHLAIDRAVIGGTSAGSGTAIAFALRHPARARALVIAQPLFEGADVGLAAPARAAMLRMAELGERAEREGIEAIVPLYAALPAPIRDGAIAMARGFDPASVAATTRFLASGAQPFSTLADLAALRMPVVIVPGADPEHPAEVAVGYARVISGARLVGADADVAAIVERL